MRAGECDRIVATVAGDHRPGRVHRVLHQGSAQLADRKAGGRGGRGARRWGTPGDIQRQHPAALGFRHRHQPLVLPAGHDAVLGHASRHAMAVRPLWTGARLGAGPGRAVHDPQRAHEFPGGDRRQAPQQHGAHHVGVHLARGQRVGHARPPTPEGGRQTQARECLRAARREHGVERFEQALLALAQAGGIQGSAKVREIGGCVGR